MPGPSSAPHAQLVWYIRAAERVWGPYRQARLAGFVVEKRLTADTLIATRPGGPFGPAGGRRELQRLFEPFATPVETTPQAASPPAPLKKAPETAALARPESGRKPVPASPPEPSRQPGLEPASASAPAAVTPEPPRPPFSRKVFRKTTAAEESRRTLLVWVDLTSLNAQAFETALAQHGTFAGVRPGVWLVRAEADAAALRNALSRELTGEDALLVVEAALAKAAWFNLDLEAESNLRHLWAGGDDALPGRGGGVQT